MTEEDKLVRQNILDLMRNHITNIDNNSIEYQLDTINRLEGVLENGLIEIQDKTITVTELGKPFVRNIAMCLDARYWSNVPTQNLFSKSV